MSYLPHIMESVCPECQATVRAEARFGLHCNGHWNEYREFKCGRKIEYCPNFQHEAARVVSSCTYSEAFRKQQTARQALLKGIITKIINAKHVGLDWAERLCKDLERYL